MPLHSSLGHKVRLHQRGERSREERTGGERRRGEGTRGERKRGEERKETREKGKKRRNSKLYNYMTEIEQPALE